MAQGNRESKPRAWTTNAILALVEPLIRRLIRRALNGTGGIGGDDIDHGGLTGLGDDDHAQYLIDLASTGGDGINVASRIVSVDLDSNPGLSVAAAGLILSLITLTSESVVDPANDQIAFMDNSSSDAPRRTDIQNMYDAAAKESVVTRDLAYLAWRDFL